ncbi:ABC transporter permease [Terrimonas alba]|uniref:ABC transporter permease n=1 Tax=Terrimonas alba TaxID=3349636 RepID=UPI0035F2E4F7
MFRNYFSVAFRNLKRHKIFSLINISGLAIGISAALVIYLIVQYEFSFDTFHKDGNKIYRIVSKIEFPDLTINNSGVPVPTAKAVRNEATGIDVVTNFIIGNAFKVSVPLAGAQSPAVFKNQQGIIYADEEYFTLFQYDWLAGHAQTAMKDPFQVVLTESRLKAYFSTLSPNDVVGRTIYYDDSVKATVVGVVKDLTKPTDFAFKEFISRATAENTGIKNHWGWEEWGSINSASQLFIKLKSGTKPAQIEKQLAALRNKYRQRRPQEPEKDDTQHFLQPVNDIHFNPHYDAMNQRQASKPSLYGLLAVASFLLLLGCINFINLTTAQASARAKEIGIRKTIGGAKKQLIVQFLSETFVLTILATILSVIITPGLLNVFSDFIPPGVSFASLNRLHVWIFLVLLMLLVTLLSGFYPAWVLTKFKPVTVLKNQAYSGTAQIRKAWLRKTLTVTQFVIAQFLIIATLVVSKQVHYSLNKDLGYKRDAIVFFNTRWNFFSDQKDNRRFVLQEKLKAIPEIEKLSLAGSSPASTNFSTTTMKYKNGDKLIETMVEVKYADTAYFDLYKMKLLAGKNLQQSDTAKEFVINETYVKLLGFKNPADAVGKLIERDHFVPVIGVIRDFHANSTRHPIKPLAYSAAAENSYTFHIALKPRGADAELWKRALAKMEKAFKEIYPEDDFEYKFYDESIASFYKTEQNISSLLRWSAGLCIFISCLGLLGLVIYITNTRTKEIGVRKVLGASVAQIVSLLSKDFLSLVLIAFLIALPLAWWAMHNWLQDFAYRTALSWWVFAVTGAGMLLIAMLILSIRTIRSAIENPVKALRTE